MALGPDGADIARTEVTLAEFDAFVEDSNYEPENGCRVWVQESRDFEIDGQANWRAPGFGQGADQPVACVSWEDATAYVDWLSKRTGEDYRLPTEVEWEYAARAGTQTPYFWGTAREAACGYANGFDATARASGRLDLPWIYNSCADEAVFTAPTSRPADNGAIPNGFALVDIFGNVWEWTEDCWHDNYEEAPPDSRAWLSEEDGDCSRRVIRGGSFSSVFGIFRSASRLTSDPDNRSGGLGFRPARTLTS